MSIQLEYVDLSDMHLQSSHSTIPREYVWPQLLLHLAGARVLSLVFVFQLCFNCLDVDFQKMLICSECQAVGLCPACIVLDKRVDTTVFRCFACATKKGEALPVCKSLP